MKRIAWTSPVAVRTARSSAAIGAIAPGSADRTSGGRLPPVAAATSLATAQAIHARRSMPARMRTSAHEPSWLRVGSTQIS